MPRKREWCNGPAESKNQGMYARILHGNREIPGATELVPKAVRLAKARGRNADMHATGKSDTGILSMKRANKGAQPRSNGRPPAEFVEKRPVAKGNPEQATATGTQGPQAALSALGRVREADQASPRLT